jgi:tetratricopeptide (TPR) repeat protein
LPEFDKAADLDPLNAEPHFYRAMIYFDDGDDVQAIIEMHRAVDLQPLNLNYLLSLGVLYQEMGRLDEAIESYTKALQLNPRFVAALINRCMVYVDKLNVKAALDDCNAVLAMNPNNLFALYHRARAYSINAKDYPLAIADLKRIIELYPDYEYAYEQLGHLYFAQKDYVQAKQAYDQYFRLTREPSPRAQQEMDVIKRNLPAQTATPRSK